MPKFTLTSLSDPSKSIEFEQEIVTVGRAMDNDFVVKDGTVSRYQAELTRQSDSWQLINVGRFPVKVNKIPTAESVLNSGDILTLGNEKFKFELSGSPQPDDMTVTAQATDKTVTTPRHLLEDPDDESKQTVIFKRPWCAEDSSQLAVKQRTTACGNNTTASANLKDSGEETLIDGVPAILTEMKGANPGKSFALEKTSSTIGRAPDCDIVIDDKRISRRHFAIEKRASEYHLVRLTTHQTVLVNNQAADECRLYNNDQIEVFTHSYQFKSTSPADQRTALLRTTNKAWALDATACQDATFLKARVVAKKPGPRLINHNKHGHSTVYHLNPNRTCIGRDQSNDIVIEGDKSISRLHSVIEKQSKGHFISAESNNPLLVNGRRIRNSTRLYSGDNLQMGETLLTFLSEFKGDTATSKKITSGILFGLTSVASAAFIGVLVYFFLWQPWNFNKQYDVAQQHVANTEYQQGQEILQTLYTRYPGESERNQVTALLAEAVVKKINADIQEENLQQSKALLNDFLREYGNGSNHIKVWQKLNEVRFLLAKKNESENKVTAALREYVTIDINSAFYNSAQKAISDIWLLSQQQGEQAKAEDGPQIDALMQEANELFDKKHYLTPRSNNAYAKYAQILAHDPDNPMAIEKIEQIKNFYLTAGNRSCLQGDQVKAETYRRRYLIIDPENKAMQQALNRVDQCTGTGAIAANNSASGGEVSATPTAASANPAQLARQTATAGTNANNQKSRQNVQKLLEKEGVESEWIIDYLFDEPGGLPEQANSDTPW